jgi:hypothetical protein
MCACEYIVAGLKLLYKVWRLCSFILDAHIFVVAVVAVVVIGY